MPDNVRGKSDYGEEAREPQEKYEGKSSKVDLKDGNFTQNPFELMAPETDHTPNHTKGPKPAKPEYGHFTGRDSDGMKLKGGY